MSDLVCAECTQPAQLKCSACKLVAYCNKEHQKSHWKTHKNECRPFEIQTSEALGKHLVATRDIAPGDQILSEYPIIYGPRPHSVEEGPIPCPGCCRLIIAETSPRCEGCDWPVCHPNCMGLKDPNKHGHECLVLSLRTSRAIQSIHDFYRQDALLALRCLIQQKKGIKKWEQIMEMQSHYDKRGPNTETYQDVDERIVKYLQRNFIDPLRLVEQQTKKVFLPDVSDEIIHKICGIIDVNALEITQDAEMSALYPTAYLLEHSCLPNTYHVFEDASDGYKIIVKAALPIKKGDHISTMYTHALWGTQARREHLQETKYFSCFCKRCKDPTELGTYLSALKCLGVDAPCGGTHLPLDPCDIATEWTCDKCNVKISNGEVAELVNQIGEEVDHVQLSNPTVKELTQLLEKMLTFLHPNHYHIYSIKHSLVQLYGYQQGYMPNQISDELLEKKAEMCRELLAVTKVVDPGNSRLCLYTGVLLHELHLADMYYIKRKWYVDKKEELVKLVKEAQDSIKEAKEVLKNETISAAGEKLQNVVAGSAKDLKIWLDRNETELAELNSALQ